MCREPGILECFSGSWSAGRIRVKEAFDESFGLGGNIFPVFVVKLDSGFGRFADEDFDFVRSERGVTAKEDISDYSGDVGSARGG